MVLSGLHARYEFKTQTPHSAISVCISWVKVSARIIIMTNLDMANLDINTQLRPPNAYKLFYLLRCGSDPFCKEDKWLDWRLYNDGCRTVTAAERPLRLPSLGGGNGWASWLRTTSDTEPSPIDPASMSAKAARYRAAADPEPISSLQQRPQSAVPRGDEEK